MKTSRMGMSVSALCGVAIGLAGCSSASADWNKANTANTITAYQDFISAHPKNEHVSEAQAFILQLQDDAGWLEAQHGATSAAYHQYLEHFPKGVHVQAAQEATTAIDRAAAWKTAQMETTSASIQSFLQKYPTGPEADQAKDMLKSRTGYLVRLAREPSEEKAQRKLAELKNRFDGQLHDLFITPPATGDKFFDIASASSNEEDANAKCRALKRDHVACQVIRR